MNGVDSPAPATTTPRRSRIVHLSDIHFGSHFNSDQWNSVRDAVEDARPDFIIVSGDFVQSPFPLMLILARRELDALSARIDSPWFSIPGNHDVAFYGNARIWPFTRLFSKIFSPDVQHKKWILKYPTFSDFYRRGRLSRGVFRTLWYLRFFACFHWARLPREVSYPHVVSPAGAVPFDIIALDSNRSFFLAAGRVPKNQVSRIGAILARLNSRKLASEALKHRIVVLHHHPVPIPYSSESATNFEPFLVLREGGTLLNELWLHDVDLILHGHRHLTNFSRIAYGSVPQSPRTLAVLSAASPTAQCQSRGGNSFNVIDLYANGRITVIPVTFGGGVTIKGISSSRMDAFDALSLDEIKVRNYRRSLNMCGFQAAEVERAIIIGNLGETQTLLRVADLTQCDGGNLSVMHHQFGVDLGWIDPLKIRLVNATPSVSIQNRTPTSGLARLVDFDVVMPTLGRGVKISYGIQYYTTNNFRLSEWESKVVHPADEESMSIRVRYAWRSLRLSVTLPTTLSQPGPVLRCYMPGGYPRLRIDPHTQEIAPPADDDWHLDADMTERERGGLVEAGPGRWQVSIAHPLMGYRYEIAWAVKDKRETQIDSYGAGQTDSIRKSALRYRERRIATALDPAAAWRTSALRKALELSLVEFQKRFASQADPLHERLRACMFTFDGAASPNQIVAIEEVSLPSASLDTDLKHWVTPYGEGVAGLAFKTSNPQLYFAAAVRLGQPASGGFFPLADELGLEAVLAIPVFHPAAWAYINGLTKAGKELDWSDLPSVHQAFAVITFSSDSSGSAIGSFYDDVDSVRVRHGRLFEFFEIIQKVAPAIVNSLANSAFAPS
jgi:3',5'-cyclic AMP phosphodiesterase CpdA